MKKCVDSDYTRISINFEEEKSASFQKIFSVRYLSIFNCTIKIFAKFNFLLANRELGELDICLLKQSGGFIGLLLLIDCNSRYLWFHKLKSKKKEQVVAGLDAILKQSGKFERIVSDGKVLMTSF